MIDRRVFGEQKLRVIYRWVLPGFLLAVAILGLILEIASGRATSIGRGVIIVAAAVLLLAYGPPGSKRSRR